MKEKIEERIEKQQQQRQVQQQQLHQQLQQQLHQQQRHEQDLQQQEQQLQLQQQETSRYNGSFGGWGRGDEPNGQQLQPQEGARRASRVPPLELPGPLASGAAQEAADEEAASVGTLVRGASVR